MAPGKTSPTLNRLKFPFSAKVLYSYPLSVPEISSLSNIGGSYYAYFDPDSPLSALKALNDLRDYLLTEGPFDGVLAFSQGANLAAMHAIRESQRDYETDTPSLSTFRLLVLLSASVVHDPVAFEKRGEIKALSSFASGELIQIPTVHIWGGLDAMKEESAVSSKLFSGDLSTVFVHSGAHDIPAKHDITEAVKAMRRGIFTTQLLK